MSITRRNFLRGAAGAAAVLAAPVELMALAPVAAEVTVTKSREARVMVVSNPVPESWMKQAFVSRDNREINPAYYGLQYWQVGPDWISSDYLGISREKYQQVKGQ